MKLGQARGDIAAMFTNKGWAACFLLLFCWPVAELWRGHSITSAIEITAFLWCVWHDAKINGDERRRVKAITGDWMLR